MFSRRIPEAFEPNALSRLRDEKLRAGVPLIDLTESNPTRVGLAPASAEIAAALAGLPLGRYEPESVGLLAAREAVARYHAARGARVPAERIALTSGTSESYAHLFRLLAEPGDQILVPRPSYPLLETLAALESVHLTPYALRFRGRWEIDIEEIAGAGPRVRAVVVVNPNNPTGSFASLDEATAIEEICARRGWALIADEVFTDFVFEAALPRRATFADASQGLVFILNGLSKTAGLPQMKLGWIAVAGAREAADAAVARVEWIADAFLSVSSPVQLAAARLFTLADSFQERTRARVRANLKTLARAVAERPELELLPVEGGWSAVLRVPRVRSEEAWALAVLERGVVVHPGHFYDFEGEAYLVVSLLPDPRAFAEGIANVAAQILA